MFYNIVAELIEPKKRERQIPQTVKCFGNVRLFSETDIRIVSSIAICDAHVRGGSEYNSREIHK